MCYSYMHILVEEIAILQAVLQFSDFFYLNLSEEPLSEPE